MQKRSLNGISLSLMLFCNSASLVVANNLQQFLRNSLASGLRPNRELGLLP
jgi:hypothetical protein